VRLPLVLAAVLLCYQFEWTGLRYLTSEVALRFAEWRGFAANRLGTDLIAWNGERFRFGIGCTFADVFCGAIPLIWVRSFGAPRNILNIGVLAVGLLGFNLLRRTLTDLIFGFAAWVPWPVLDQAIGGLSYFAVWVCLVRWLEQHASPMRATTAATPSAVAP